jgi:hypothetical protein
MLFSYLSFKQQVELAAFSMELVGAELTFGYEVR